jgi:hypothetical protein
MLADYIRRVGLTDEDVDACEQTRDRRPVELHFL